MKSSQRGLCTLFALLTIGYLFFGAGVPNADAVPVFSRKYQTSCQTCHVIFPKLNPFGEAFRLNGYRMPGETEEQVKQKPVSLGAEAYEKLWPKMVYPSTLPGNVPFALNTQFADIYQSSQDEAGREITHNDFQFPQEVNLFAAGTLGKHAGFFAELTWGELPDGSSETEIEHARFDWDSAFGPEHLFNFRLGKMAPNAWDGFQEMWIMTYNGIDTLFAYNPIGLHGGVGTADEGAGVSLPAEVRGIEMYGIAAHRFMYDVGFGAPIGIGEGGPLGSFGSNSQKDAWARLDYKFGGMGLDGDTTGVKLPPENWEETSFRLGVFGYWGDGSGIDFPITDEGGNSFNQQDTRYQRAGVYGSLYLGPVNIFGVGLHGWDKLALFDPTTGAQLSSTSTNYNSWFVQGDWVIVPPFQTSVRYEQLNPADKSVVSSEVLTANLSYLAAANIKVMVEYHRDLRNSLNYTIAGVLRAAF